MGDAVGTENKEAGKHAEEGCRNAAAVGDEKFAGVVGVNVWCCEVTDCYELVFRFEIFSINVLA